MVCIVVIVNTHISYRHLADLPMIVMGFQQFRHSTQRLFAAVFLIRRSPAGPLQLRKPILRPGYIAGERSFGKLVAQIDVFVKNGKK